MKELEEAVTSFARATESGQTEEAERAAMRALILAGEEALRNPTPSLKLKEQAAECESRRDWAGAEEAYRKVLALDETRTNPGMLAKANIDLCRLMRCLGRLDEAWQFALAATDCARATGIFPVLFMALEAQVACALAKSEPQAALSAASESVRVIEPGKLYDATRARALIARARCLVALGQVEEAVSDLEASRDILQAPGISRTLSGPVFGMAQWWEVKTLLHLSQGELSTACDAASRAVEYRRQLQGPYAELALAEGLQKFADLAGACGQAEASERALAEAGQLRSNLRLPRDPYP